MCNYCHRCNDVVESTEEEVVFLATGEEDMSQRTYYDTNNASRGLGKFIAVVLGGSLVYIGKFLVGEGFDYVKMREWEMKITNKIEECEDEIDIYTTGKIT